MREMTIEMGLLLGLVTGACQETGPFICTSSRDCVGEGGRGVCEVTGFCSFPDQACPSERRYGLHAGGLSGLCVEESSGTGDDGGLTSVDASTTRGGDDSSPESGPGDDTATQGPGDPVLEFSDDREEDFAAGTLLGVRWFGGGVRLEDATQGALVSRVFDAGASVSWASVRWVPRAPYGKPLPRGGESESSYGEGNADMRDTLLLLHLDGDGEAGPGSLLEDVSGQGYDLRLEATAGVPRVPGTFGEALVDDIDSYAHNDEWKDSFSFGEDDFTWSLWARTAVSCNGESFLANQVFLGLDGEGAERSHLWLGCRHSGSSECPDPGTSEGRLGGNFAPVHSSGHARVCSAQELVDDQWHHLAVTKSGHANTVVSLYFDGARVDEHSVSFEEPVAFPGGTELALGAFSGGTFPASAMFDEVAIWRRSLSPGEVASLYRRGVLRLRVQVRACDDPQCASGGEFIGPDGSSQTSYEDRADGPVPATEAVLAGIEGRYFQYRVEFEGILDASPVLEAVDIAASAL